MRGSVEQQRTDISCVVHDFLKAHPQLAQGCPSPHAQPRFSEAEVLTSALWQGGLDVATLKQTSRLVAQNWRAALPSLASFKQGLTRGHPLWPQVGRLVATTCTQAWSAARLSLMDSKPSPLCLSLRPGRVRLVVRR